MMKTQQKVIWSASPTPFLSDGSLDARSIEKLVEQHLQQGISGLFLCGTCGEGPYMPDEQRGELVSRVKRLAGKRLHLAVQVSDTSAARVRINMQRMTDAGADSLVIAQPWIMARCNVDFLRRYFLEPIESATLPVGIYLLKTELLTPDAPWLAEAALHPKVKFIKDSTASVEFIKALTAFKARRPDLRLLTGYEFDVPVAVAAGYDGGLLGTGILIGVMIRRCLDALAAGDRAGADAWQQRSNAFLHDLFRRDISGWMGGLKYALVRLGIFSTEFMHLSYSLSDEDRRRIDAALDREREFICAKGC